MHQTDKNGRTTLHRAAAQGNVKKIEKLIRPKININQPDHNGQTALHLAAQAGHVQVVKRLLAHQANPKLTDQNGQTALHLAAQAGHVQVVKILQSTAEITDKNGLTPLYLATQQGHNDVVSAFLDFEPRSLGKTVCAAIKQGNAAMIEQLLTAPKKYTWNFSPDRSFHCEVIGENGKPHYASPLELAAAYGQNEVTALLLAHGANVNAAFDASFAPLFVASKAGHAQVVETLLQHGADPTISSRYLTPLLIASQQGHVSVVEVLLKHGVRTDQKESCNGWEALHLASFYNHPEVIALLLKHGADINAPKKTGKGFCMNSQEEYTRDIHTLKDGGTALHIAVQQNHPAVVKLLLDHGANVNLKDTYGQTPRQYAQTDEIIQLFEK